MFEAVFQPIIRRLVRGLGVAIQTRFAFLVGRSFFGAADPIRPLRSVPKIASKGQKDGVDPVRMLSRQLQQVRRVCDFRCLGVLRSQRPHCR